MRIHVICKKHGTTALVGPGTLLGELECVTCIAEYDAETAWRPCCSAYNTTCCGHDDGSDEYMGPLDITITSPNYCDVKHEYDEVPF